MKVSIVTVVRNCREYVSAAIESVLEQRHCEVEYIIIDGGSTDGTLQQIDSYRPRLAHFISEPDRGLYDAMNKGLGLATGEIVGFLNADDVYEGDEVLAHVVSALERDGADCLYGDIAYVRPHDLESVIRYWRSGQYYHGKFRWGWMPPHPAFFARRTLYEAWGRYSLDLAYAADYELMFRFLHRYRAEASYLPELLVRMRTGGHSNRTVRARIRANLEVLRAWRLNGYKPRWSTAVLKPLSKLPQYVRRFH